MNDIRLKHPYSYYEGIRRCCESHGIDPEEFVHYAAAEAGFTGDFEKQAGMEKKAVIPALALSIPFALLNAYSALKHGGKSIKAFSKGDTKQGWKDSGWTALNAALAIPLLGMLGKPLLTGSRALRAASKAGKGLSAANKAKNLMKLEQLIPSDQMARWGAKMTGWGDKIHPWLGKGMGYTGKGVAAPFQGIAKGEQALFRAAGKYAPGMSDRAAEGISRLAKSRLVDNLITRWEKRHPFLSFGAYMGADPVGTAAFGSPYGPLPTAPSQPSDYGRPGRYGYPYRKPGNVHRYYS